MCYSKLIRKRSSLFTEFQTEILPLVCEVGRPGYLCDLCKLSRIVDLLTLGKVSDWIICLILVCYGSTLALLLLGFSILLYVWQNHQIKPINKSANWCCALCLLVNLFDKNLSTGLLSPLQF